MRVGMYYNNSKVLVEEQPKPEIDGYDILIKVMASGICGSDIMEWYRIKKAPLVLGHELTGEVVAVGSKVTRFKKGDRVFTTHHVPCGKCESCLKGHETACVTFQTKNNFTPGGFSEYLRVSGRSVETGTFLLPEEVSYEEGSFVEPLGTAVRGLRAAGLKPGDRLLVLGCGIIGLLMIKLARVLGAGRIMATDLIDDRLEAARRFGAENTFRADSDVPSRMKNVCSDRLADKVMICAGSLAASNQALQCVERGGTVVFFAVPKPGENISVDFNDYWRNDITFRTCYGSAPADNLQALELIRSKSVVVGDMITHRLRLDDISQGFQAAAKGENCLKVIIEPNRK